MTFTGRSDPSPKATFLGGKRPPYPPFLQALGTGQHGECPGHGGGKVSPGPAGVALPPLRDWAKALGHGDWATGTGPWVRGARRPAVGVWPQGSSHRRRQEPRGWRWDGRGHGHRGGPDTPLGTGLGSQHGPRSAPNRQPPGPALNAGDAHGWPGPFPWREPRSGREAAQLQALRQPSGRKMPGARPACELRQSRAWEQRAPPFKVPDRDG